MRSRLVVPLARRAGSDVARSRTDSASATVDTTVAPYSAARRLGIGPILVGGTVSARAEGRGAVKLNFAAWFENEMTIGVTTV